MILDCHLTNKGEEKVEAFNVGGFLPHSLIILVSPWTAWSSELEDHSYRKSDFPVDTEVLREQLYQLNIRKCKSLMGFDPEN